MLYVWLCLQINAEMKSLDGALADVSKPPPSEKSQEMSGESKDYQKTAKGKRAKVC